MYSDMALRCPYGDDQVKRRGGEGARDAGSVQRGGREPLEQPDGARLAAAVEHDGAARPVRMRGGGPVHEPELTTFGAPPGPRHRAG